MLGKRRKSELEYYQPNAAGEYMYTGELYAYAGEIPRKRLLAELFTLCGGAAAAVLGAGFLPTQGMTGRWYVPIPYALSLVMIAASIWSLMRLLLAGDPIRQFVYESAARNLPVRTSVAAVLCGLTAAGEGVFLLLHPGQDALSAALGFLGLMALSCGLCALGRCRMRCFKWEKR